MPKFYKTFAPPFTILLNSFSRLPGENSKEIVARLRRDLLPTMLNGVMYWPMCDFITFRFAPVHLQVCANFFLHFSSYRMPYNCKFGMMHDMYHYKWEKDFHSFFVLWNSGCFLMVFCICLFDTAISQQFIFVFVDHLYDLYGKPRESRDS